MRLVLETILKSFLAFLVISFLLASSGSRVLTRKRSFYPGGLKSFRTAFRATRSITFSLFLCRIFQHRNVALSVKEIRKVAQSGSDQTRSESAAKSARRQISSWPELPSPSTKNTRKPAPSSLPIKYEMLAEFFDCLDSSIRLSRLKGSMTSYSNLCPKIESLTNRRFSHANLAQLKYVLPEAIELKKVLKFDDRTCCMKPDIHVSINVDAIELDSSVKSESKNMNLRKIFRSRLADFCKSHPEGDDIPEDVLPEPFNHPKQDLVSQVATSSGEVIPQRFIPPTPTDASAPEEQQQQPAVATHLSRSFRPRFSRKVTHASTELVQQNCIDSSSQLSVLPNPESCLQKSSSMPEVDSSAKSLVEVASESSNAEKCSSSSSSLAAVPVASLPETPSKEMLVSEKLATTPLMSITPSLQASKKCRMSPDEDSSLLSPKKLIRRPARPRSLKSLQFDTLGKNIEDEQNEIEEFSSDDDFSSIFSKSLLQSIKEKERKAKEEQDPSISQAKWRRHMIACLPKLFNMIHFLFQSIKQSVITKEELMHKIVSSHLDIVDTREIEEQLKLLLELVPEWISEKLTSSGDILLRINKSTNPETIRAQLEEAK